MNPITKILSDLKAKGIRLALDDNQNLTVKGDKSALTGELIGQIKAHKQSLVDVLKAAGVAQGGAAKIAVATDARKSGALPLSYAQQRLWLLDQLEQGSSHYHIFAALQLKGAVNTNAVSQAFKALVQRHESLRTVFRTQRNGTAVQHILDQVEISVPLEDISILADPHGQLQQRCKVEADVPFDLSQDAPVRARLLKLAQSEYVLMVTMHHIASDGWSMAVVVKDFAYFYRQQLGGNSIHSRLPQLEIQYADYAAWQRSDEQQQKMQSQLDYWARQLADLPLVHNLPLDAQRPQLKSFAGKCLESRLDKATTERLKQLCRQQQASLFMGLQAVFAVLLGRYGNTEDVVMGTPIANREQSQIEPLIGFFVNSLVLRSDLSGDPDFVTLLGQSKQMLLSAYGHQQVPFDQVVERLQPQRQLSHSPLFQVMLVLQNNEKANMSMPGVELTPLNSDEQAAMYDLTLTVVEAQSGLQLSWQYDCALFAGQTIERMAQHFETLAHSLVQNPQTPVFQVPMLSQQEQQRQLQQFNQSAGRDDIDGCLHQLFERQVAKTPDATALVFEGKQLSYAALNAQANRLAGYLIEYHRAGPETLVGICVERSMEMIVAMLAVLKAGSAYVCLDPQHPQKRLNQMLEDAKPVAVITQGAVQAKLSDINKGQLLYLDDIATKAVIDCFDDNNLNYVNQTLSGKNLAYAIYTSGSTGKPKGVLVEHGPVSAHIRASIANYGLTAKDRALQFANINFDAAHEQVFFTLCSGASLYIRPAKHWDVSEFYRYCLTNELTVVNVPPAYCYELLYDKALSHEYFAQLKIRALLLGGEPVSPQLLQLWRELPSDCQLINLYGPTETVITCCVHHFDKKDQSEPVLIGRAGGNRSAYVLNQGQLVPVGVSGELHIGGDLLARGYMNLPELTRERFIDNPFYDADDPNSHRRLYKTGDLASWNDEGLLSCHGRIDSQLKIRGFRVEPAEIEQQLAEMPGINRALVTQLSGQNGQQDLVAYLVADDDLLLQQSTVTALLRQALEQSLPGYMVPDAIVLLDALPLTLNGKIDFKRLPQPSITKRQTFIAPETEIELKLAALWGELLGIEQVGKQDNFFSSGGHSLLATRLSTLLKRQFNVDLPLPTLFELQTLEAQASHIDEQLLLQKLANGEIDIDDMTEAQLDHYLAMQEVD